MSDSNLTWALLAGFGLVAVLVLFAAVEEVLRGRGAVGKRIRAAGFRFRKNMQVPDGRGGWRSVDYILAAAAGLVCVELRDYNGTVEGTADDRIWSHSTRMEKFRFLNPLTAQAAYISAIEKLCPGIPVHGLVLFPDQVTFVDDMPRGVWKNGDLEVALREFSGDWSDDTAIEQALKTLQPSLAKLRKHRTDAKPEAKPEPETQA